MTEAARVPSLLIRRMTRLAVADELAAMVLQRPEEYGVDGLKATYSSNAAAWADLVLLDGWRAIRLWRTPLPFSACLQVTTTPSHYCSHSAPPPPTAHSEAR